MTGFPKPERCVACKSAVRREWIAPILCSGKVLAGTGVWRSGTIDGRCTDCHDSQEASRLQQWNQERVIRRLIELFGGVRPYREFTFERFRVTPETRRAFEKASNLDTSKENLYLWGGCGVGKTHLAYATARRAVEAGQTAEVIPAPLLTRRLRLKDPVEEQAGINHLIRAVAFVLDDLGTGSPTAYFRQVLQEILDGRRFRDRAGMVITSKYSLADLAQRLDDDTIPSRLAGMCEIIQMSGPDSRLRSMV
jgi:DNA replication protein DnaC